MITHIRMKNFKSWKDSGEVQLAPLTGFFGTNSSGKSSLLQMLLLLKQTIGTEEVLFFGDENSLIYLDTFRDVVNIPDLPVELGFSCKLEQPRPIYTTLKDEPPSILMMEGFTFDTTLSEAMRRPIVENFRYRINQNGILELVWERQELAFGNQIEGDSFETAPLKNIKNCFGVPLTLRGKPHRFLLQFSSAFEELFSDVYYLGTTRNIPLRHYRRPGLPPRDTGLWVNNDIDKLILACLREQESLHQETQIPLEKQISKWLQKLGIAYAISIALIGSRNHIRYEVRIQKSQMGEMMIPINIGGGFTELLPVLMLCYCVPEGSTLILEHPGSLLHPMVQSQLADLLIEVVNERNLQILVESHSEHLLNRLQRRIAEEKISVDKTALYFCRNDEGVSNIERLKMDEFGNISNWPENFFGNEMGDLFAMTEAQRERRKRAEGE